MLPKIIHPSWEPIFSELSDHTEHIRKSLLKLRPYFPTPDKIFAAFQVPFDDLSVVIIGQDPYPRKGYATGVAFAVPEQIETSPTLEIIFDTVAIDTYNIAYKGDCTLKNWTDQGILLLNSALTVKPNMPNHKSHVTLWHGFMLKLVSSISKEKELIWLLWGDRAKSLKKGIEQGHILETVHPVYDHYQIVPQFRKAHHFRKANQWLELKGRPKIDW